MTAAGLMLAACASSSVKVSRDLPAPPAYLREVHVAQPRLNEDLLAIAVRERRGREKANKIIGRARSAWETMRATYKAGR